MSSTPVNIKKTEETLYLKIVYAEVLVPDIPDSQGEFIGREEIRKAAHLFMKNGNLFNIDLLHNNEPTGSYVVESFIARDDDTIFIRAKRSEFARFCTCSSGPMSMSSSTACMPMPLAVCLARLS